MYKGEILGDAVILKDKAVKDGGARLSARLTLHGGRTRVASAGDALVVFVSRKPPAAVATVRTALKMPPPFEIPPSLRADASTPAVAEQPSWRTQLQELVLAMSAPSG